MPKLNDLEKNKKKQAVEEIEAQSSAMGFDDIWSGPRQNDRKDTGLKDMIGLCHDCLHLEYCRTEFGNVHARCGNFEIQMTGRSRIKDCNQYSQRGQMKLRDAMDLAWIIDDTNKTKVGF